MENKTKIIFAVAGSVLLVVAGVVLYKKFSKKDDSVDDTEANQGVENEPKKQISVAAPTITVPKAGTNIYSLNPRSAALLTTRKTTSNNEKAGDFKGYRTISGNVYAYFYDKLNGGTQSFVLKSATNLNHLK